MKLASICYALALLSLPVGPACKMLLGHDDMLWVDPTLVFSVLAFVLLLPGLRESDVKSFGGASKAAIGLIFLCLICSLMGMFLRPPAGLYDVLREPERLVLTLVWFLTTSCFIRLRPLLVTNCTAIAVVFGLASGLYIYLAALGAVPATEAAISYSRRYLIQQAVWYDGLLVPRMGGLFTEAPPFGLFMLSMGVFFWVARRSGARSRLILIGSIVSVVGVVASFAGQVLLGAGICVVTMVLSSKMQKTWLKPVMICVIACILLAAGWQSLVEKGISQATTATTSKIYQDSVGERNFHLSYGISLLAREPLAALLGIGPGRYGEYAADTGYFPDTATMQFTLPELLVEWGVVGLGVWCVILTTLAFRVVRVHNYAGLFVLFGLLVADSFQANWKSEAVFLAIAALCTPLKESISSAADAGQNEVSTTIGPRLASSNA